MQKQKVHRIMSAFAFSVGGKFKSTASSSCGSCASPVAAPPAVLSKGMTKFKNRHSPSIELTLIASPVHFVTGQGLTPSLLTQDLPPSPLLRGVVSGVNGIDLGLEYLAVASQVLCEKPQRSRSRNMDRRQIHGRRGIGDWPVPAWS